MRYMKNLSMRSSRFLIISSVEMIEIIKNHIAGSDNPIHKKILKGKYNPKLAVTMSLCSRRFDLYVTDFLSEYTEGTVINLGVD